MAEQRASADDLARHPKHPVARVVECRGVFWRACHMRLHNLKDEEIVGVHQAPSCSRHSKLAWHSEMRGAATESASLRVRPNSENLSTFVPDVLPMPTTTSVSAVVGKLMTHSRLLYQRPSVLTRWRFPSRC